MSEHKHFLAVTIRGRTNAEGALVAEVASASRALGAQCVIVKRRTNAPTYKGTNGGAQTNQAKKNASEHANANQN